MGLPTARPRLPSRSAPRATSSRQPPAAGDRRVGRAPDAASRVATQQQLDHAFRRLGVEHRTVVVLIHYLGLSTNEAAEVIGIPAGTVRSRLHYALNSLRAAVEADARLERSEGTA